MFVFFDMVLYLKHDTMSSVYCESLKCHKSDCDLILVSGIAAYMTVNILKLPSLELQHVAKVLDKIFLFFPHYSLCASVHGLYTNYAYNKACSLALLIPGMCIQPNPCCKGK